MGRSVFKGPLARGLMAGAGVGLAALGLARVVWAAGAPVLTPAQLVPTLHKINLMEIEAGKMAREMGTSQAMKDYGDKLERDHAAAEDQLAGYAKRSGVDIQGPIPPAVTQDLEKAQQQMNGLKTVIGPAFDRRFAQQMLGDHKKAIAIVDRSEPLIKDPQLKGLLAVLEPTLRSHEQIAANLLKMQQGVSLNEASAPPVAAQHLPPGAQGQ